MNVQEMTVAELKAEAAECYTRAAESFERCDTDGFLSQWANGLTGRLCDRQAEIAANGGMAEFWGLYDLDGNRLAAKMIDGRYGTCWAICDAKGKFTGKFIGFCEAAGELFAHDGGTFVYLDDNGQPDEVARAKARKHLEARVKRWEAKYGVSQRREMAPAYAKIDGKGTGLSGSAWVGTFRKDGGYPAGSKVVG